MAVDLDLLKDEPLTLEQAAEVVVNNGKGYSIKGVMPRGMEVAAYDELKPELGWVQLSKYGISPSAMLSAEREAKHWFRYEDRMQEERVKKAKKAAEKDGVAYVDIPDTRRAIRIRYIVSLDPSTIAEIKE